MDEPAKTANTAPSEPESQPAKPFACTQCDKAFGRLTHLRRHEQSHQEDAAHLCPICNKSFARLDSLKRHKQTHDDPQRQAGNKVPKACSQCVGAKTKCTGEQPCRRCESRSFECIYAPTTPALNACFRLPFDNTTSPHREVANAGNWLGSTHIRISSRDERLLPSASPASTDRMVTVGSSYLSPGRDRMIEADHDAFDASTPAYSTGSSGPGEKHVGRYYADGEGAKIPRGKRRKVTVDFAAQPPDDIRHANAHQFSMPNIDITDECNEWITASTYASIKENFTEHCVTTPRSPFSSPEFISRPLFNNLIHLYIGHYHQLLPILHLASIDLEGSHWTLALAVAGIGAHFLSHERSRVLTLALQEFLRRCFLELDEQCCVPDASDPINLSITQARLLHTIGMMYSGNPFLRRHALRQRHELALFCSAAWAISCNDIRQQQDISWHTWAYQESSRRTGFSIWLLDAMWMYTFSLEAQLTLENISVIMPSQEGLFEAANSLTWSELMRRTSTMPTLSDAVEALYLRKHVSATTSEFGRVLLIHALYHRTWDVERYVRHPLSHFTPTAGPGEATIRDDSRQAIQNWLPAIPLLAGWRNAACDSLDALHWTANSAINGSFVSSGIEHPTVLHLHLSRIVLLVPHASIAALASHIVASDVSSVNMWTDASTSPGLADLVSEIDAQAQIHNWLARDQYKARLSVIHAGVLFWHVGRYSAHGFYEPSAVFLASLTLWAFASFHQRTLPYTPNAQQTSANMQSARGDDDSGSESDSGRPAVINLDRPTDDELVQTFVKHGAGMRAFVTGVGDLSAEAAPRKIAERGEKLLRTLTMWGDSWRYIQVLSHLAKRDEANVTPHGT